MFALSCAAALTGAAPALAVTATGGPGTTPYWNEDGGVQGFATALSSTSKVWYTLASGALRHVYYPQTDEPDTYGPACADISNRSLTVAGGTQTDTVLNWAAPNTCGSAEAVIDVTVPSTTTGTVYTAGDSSALGTGMDSSDDWSPGLYPLTKIATNEWQVIVPAVSGSALLYKLGLGGTWTNVEEGSSYAYVSNRSFYFNGAGYSGC